MLMCMSGHWWTMFDDHCCLGPVYIPTSAESNIDPLSCTGSSCTCHPGLGDPPHTMSTNKSSLAFVEMIHKRSLNKKANLFKNVETNSAYLFHELVCSDTFLGFFQRFLLQVRFRSVI